MRFVRTIAGTLLLVIGLPALLAGGILGTLASHRGSDGAFGARLEPAETTGYALVVPDLAAALRDGIPFVRVDRERVTLTARTPAGPAFIGIAPAAQLTRYLGSAPYATLDGFAVTRGPLPVRLTPAPTGFGPASAAGASVGPALPAEQSFWARQGVGSLDWGGADLGGQRFSLIIMRPDAAAGVAADLRGELRFDWLGESSWALLIAGVLLVVIGLAVVSWPVRPREVVFVVRPSQVAALAARLGVAALDDVGRSGSARRSADWPVAAAPKLTREPASPAQRASSAFRAAPTTVQTVPTAGRAPAARSGAEPPVAAAGPTPDGIRPAFGSGPDLDPWSTVAPGGAAPPVLTAVTEQPSGSAAGDRPALTLAENLTGGAASAGRSPSAGTPEQPAEPGSPPVTLAAAAARRRAPAPVGATRPRGAAGPRGAVPQPATLSLAWPPRDARTRTPEPRPIRPVPPPDPVPPSNPRPRHAPTADDAPTAAHEPTAHRKPTAAASGSSQPGSGALGGATDDSAAQARTAPGPVSLPSAPPVPAPPPTKPAPVKPTPAPVPAPPPKRPVPTPPPKRPVPVGPGAAGPASAGPALPRLASVGDPTHEAGPQVTRLRAAVPRAEAATPPR